MHQKIKGNAPLTKGHKKDKKMNNYKVKAYYNGLLRMEIPATGKRMAEATKRVLKKDYGFKNNEIDIVKA